MSDIRCVYRGEAPNFPAIDQHPDAVRYGPIAINGAQVFVDAIGGEPSIEEIDAVLNPQPLPDLTPAEKLAAAGLTASDLRMLLGLPDA